MELANGTGVKEFVLAGFGVGQWERLLLLIFFSILYVLTLAENLTIITLVVLDTHLSQLPMYILLSNFSWLEMCYVTTTVPRMLFDLASTHGIISFHSCFLQFYLFFSLGNTECLFLSAMAFDRYLAICHPLRYTKIMSQEFCYILVVTCWIVGSLWHILPVVLISRLSFCGSNIINHFLCDPVPILYLACPPVGIAPRVYKLFMNAVVIANFSFVVLSYSVVTFTLLKSSNQGNRRKAFSTISLHLVVVTLFYGSIAEMYLTPDKEGNAEETKAVTLFYSAVNPFLNPLIYCLRNDQVKGAVGRLVKKKGRLFRSTESV